MEGRGPHQPGARPGRRLGVSLLGTQGKAPGARARRRARGHGQRRARVEGRGRGARDPARDQRAGPHPRRDPRLHARDDHGFPHRLPQNSLVGSCGGHGTIQLEGCATERGDHRDREDQVRRTGVLKPSVALLLASVLGAPASAAAATLFITNTKSESVSIIDTDTLEVVGTIPLGRGKPNRIVFHPDGKTAWVVYDKSHDLGVIDAEARKLVRRVKVGGNPYNLAFTPDGSHLLVLDWSSDTSNDAVIFYALKAEKIDGRIEVSTWPAHGVFSRDVPVSDAAARAAVTRVVHGGGDAMGLALTGDGKTLCAAAGENKAILKIDTATHKVAGQIALPGVVHEATLTLDGKFLYTTLRKTNKIVVVRTANDTIVATIPQKGYPDLVTMEPTGRYALVTNRWADLVSVIDLASHAQVRTIPVGKAPHGMALRPR